MVTQMGNRATTGPFAPLVVVSRNVIGTKPFNQLRGKAIGLHSQGGFDDGEISLRGVCSD